MSAGLRQCSSGSTTDGGHSTRLGGSSSAPFSTAALGLPAAAAGVDPAGGLPAAGAEGLAALSASAFVPRTAVLTATGGPFLVVPKRSSRNAAADGLGGWWAPLTWAVCSPLGVPGLLVGATAAAAAGERGSAPASGRRASTKSTRRCKMPPAVASAASMPATCAMVC